MSSHGAAQERAPFLDRYLPEYDDSHVHSIAVQASVERAFAAVRALDLRSSALLRALFRLRGIPASALTLPGLEAQGFTILVEAPPRELVLGVIGRFWTWSGDLQRREASEFVSFDRPGYAKAVWGFSIEPLSQGAARVVTETRVRCLDTTSRRRFRRYWRFVRPFSRWTRKETLKALKRSAES